MKSLIHPSFKEIRKISFKDRLQYRLEYLLLRPLVEFFSLLPRHFGLTVGKIVGRLLGTILFSRTHIAQGNLRASLPELCQEGIHKIAQGCWENFGMNLVEFSKIRQMSKEDFFSFVTVKGLDYLENSYREGRGAIVLTAHYGSWELAAQLFPFSGFRTAAIARRIKNPYVNDFVNRVRQTNGSQILLARNAFRESVRYLKNGKLLAMLIDQKIIEGGIQAPFLGRPAYTTSLPAILAFRYSVPIHPTHCWREGEKIVVHIAPPMDFSDLFQKENKIYEATLRMNRVIEDWVKERPEMWFWVHNRWKGM